LRGDGEGGKVKITRREYFRREKMKICTEREKRKQKKIWKKIKRQWGGWFQKMRLIELRGWVH